MVTVATYNFNLINMDDLELKYVKLNTFSTAKRVNPTLV